MTTDITVAYGDGIGPEIMDATLRILAEAQAKLNITTIEVGEAYYNKGVSTGIPPQAWNDLYRTKVLLKSPITTPQGGGYKSLNVTMRKKLGLYANIRPCRSFHPFVKGMHPMMDMVIVRENEEDLYAGIEYRHSPDAYHAMKVITRSGCERIIRYAFEYAQQNGRRKVTCMSKDNIMKMTDGTFHRVFEEIGKEYPDLQQEHYIIDIGAARIASRPQVFDVIVTENLYGDIISDIAADVSGSVGLAGSSNVGDDFAMFEAIHGSAPDIAGQNIANPSGLLNGAVMMLVHVGQTEVAETVRNAWLRTLEDGYHTADIYSPDSKVKLGTKEFADAVIAHLGEEPLRFKKERFKKATGETKKPVKAITLAKPKKTLVGADYFVLWNDSPESLAEKLHSITPAGGSLALISAKGLKVWPDEDAHMDPTDNFRCRFMGDNGVLRNAFTGEFMLAAAEAGVEITLVEQLYNYDGERGYTLSQGE